MKPTRRGTRSPAVPALLPDQEPRLQHLQTAMKRHQFQPSALLEILHVAQKLYGYLSQETLVFIARSLRLPPSKVFGVATFYHMFTLQPRARHTCTVCLGTACFMQGGGKLLEMVKEHRLFKAGETRQDQRSTLQVARCFGVCGIAPVVVYDGETAGQQTAGTLTERLNGWANG